MKKSKTVSLVLGSGGARGYAHIGVIEELERAGYTIKSISGSSMGALVGALHACGKLDEFKGWVLGLDTLAVASLLDFSWNKSGGVFYGAKVQEKLSEMIGGRKIEELPVKYTAVATDLIRNKEVWFQEGDLLNAVRASVSIPSLVTPVQAENMLLVDGGVLNPIPVAPTMSDHTDITIAVNLFADVPSPIIPISEQELEKQSSFRMAIDAIVQRTDSSVSSDTVSYHMFDIMGMTLDSIQRTLISYHLGNYPPDILINVSKDVCGTFDFHEAYRTIEAGRIALRDALQSIDKFVS